MKMEGSTRVSVGDHIVEPSDMFEGHMPDKHKNMVTVLDLAAKLASST